MCGLAGVAGTLLEPELKAFQELMVMSGFRGLDGTGVAAVPYLNKAGEQPEVPILKTSGNVYEFVDRIAFKRLIGGENRALLGHCRWRTNGEISRENSQPFEFGDLTGMHNGTLSKWAKDVLEGKNEWFPTDSMALLNGINRDGLKKTVEGMQDNEAMALVWFDKSDGTLHFYRNEERTFWYTFNKDRTCMFWASEPWFLYTALNRAKIDFQKPTALEPFVHKWIDLPISPKEQLGKFQYERVPMRHYIPPKVDKSAQGSARVFMRGGQSQLPLVTNGATLTGTKPFPSSVTTHSLISLADYKNEFDPRWRPSTMQARVSEAGGPFYKALNSDSIDEAGFYEIVAKGCALNGCVPAFGEPIKFLRDGSFLCADCLAFAKSGKDTDTTEAVVSMFG